MEDEDKMDSAYDCGFKDGRIEYKRKVKKAIDKILFKANAKNEDMELHEFNDYLHDIKKELGIGD